MLIQYYLALAAVLLSALFTRLSIPLSRYLSKRLNLLGVDAHKPDSPLIPKTGGLAVAVGALISTALVFTLFNLNPTILAGVMLSTLTAAAIGLYEDLREMNPVGKPLLLALAGLPIILLGIYYPNPDFPFIGRTRMHIIYPLLVLAGFSIISNAINSIDVLNGSMVSTSAVALTPLLIVSLMEGRVEALAMTAALMGALIAFIPENKYPAKLFVGNVGSLSTGALFTSIAVIGRIEIITIIALMPQIMNEFHIISSMGGLKSAKLVKERPVNVENGLIEANESEKAPITLVRLITARNKLAEKNVVICLIILSAYSSALALITYLLFMR